MEGYTIEIKHDIYNCNDAFYLTLSFIKNNSRVAYVNIGEIKKTYLQKFKESRELLFSDDDFKISLDSLNGWCEIKKKDNLLFFNNCKAFGEVVSELEFGFVINDEISRMFDYIIELMDKI